MIDEFPYIFGGLALAIGLTALLNSKLVLKYGMLKLVNLSLYLSIAVSLVYLLLFLNSSNPALAFLIIFLVIQFVAFGFIFGNLSALAMQPIGHIAGIGAAIFSFTAMTLSVIAALIIGHFIRDTAIPLFAGFLISGIISILLVRIILANIKMTR
jgi:DHA1 family bicyclomycin/chloramphenicol resistance-like MFS transporter